MRVGYYRLKGIRERKYSEELNGAPAFDGKVWRLTCLRGSPQRAEFPFFLPLKSRIPKGEYLEEFLRKRGLWKQFKTFAARRCYNDENLAMEVFVRRRGLEGEFLKFRDVKLVGVRLSGRAEARD